MAENPNDSFLSDDAEWVEQIHRIGTGKAHALTGGIDGNLNIQPRQLAKRTRWLKEQAATADAAVAQLANDVQALADASVVRVVLTESAVLADRHVYFLDYTDGAFDVTLPETPGATVQIVCQIVGGDLEAMAAPARPRVLRNGLPIAGADEDIELDSNHARFVLSLAADPAVGWLVNRG